jgi:hypothetical protein
MMRISKASAMPDDLSRIDGIAGMGRHLLDAVPYPLVTNVSRRVAQMR